VSLPGSCLVSLVEALTQVPYRRDPRGVVHPLAGVLATAVAAVLAGARSAAAVAEWAGDAPQPVLAGVAVDERRVVLRCEVCSRVRFPTEVNREDKHRIRTDGKPGQPVRDERGEMPDVDAGVHTKAPEGCSMGAVRADRAPRASSGIAGGERGRVTPAHERRRARMDRCNGAL
jgi:DDE_Tnp_1-associated